MERKDGKIVKLDSEDIVTCLSSSWDGIDYWSEDIVATNADEFNEYEQNMKEQFDEVTLESVYAEMLVDGKTLTVYYWDQDGDEETVSEELTLEKLIEGFRYAEEHGWDGTLENLDSVVADTIIQYALFSDIIYG